MAENLFAFLGEEVDCEVGRFVKEWPMHWSRPTSEPDEEPELSVHWQSLLADDHEYHELMHAYGY